MSLCVCVSLPRFWCFIVELVLCYDFRYVFYFVFLSSTCVAVAAVFSIMWPQLHVSPMCACALCLLLFVLFGVVVVVVFVRCEIASYCTWLNCIPEKSINHGNKYKRLWYTCMMYVGYEFATRASKNKNKKKQLTKYHTGMSGLSFDGQWWKGKQHAKTYLLIFIFLSIFAVS